MQHELLVPAGDMESLYQAIHHGCDAIYVGLKDFGARRFAKNFSNLEMIEAIKICHLYGVKLYATMNTLIKDKEVSYFLEQIEFLHKNGIDAVIMQDFGMICLVREMFPNLEIHASTQANNSSIETIQLFHDLGITRVVLPREMSIDEINRIDIDIEKEVFIHGALCISYSGNCLMSSMLGSRSGNRGECVGNCRLKYSLEEDGKIISKDQYLLSTKELNTSPKFEKLLESNIDSFKIEGRMKSPEYVGFITGFYRKLIDHQPFDLEKELEKLKALFHRGFTTGNLFKDKGIMNTTSPNHIGVEIGKVIQVDEKSITIKLSKPLNQEDGIRFRESNKGFIVNYLYDKKKRLIHSAEDIVIIDNKIGLTTKDRVFKTIDRKLINEIKDFSPKKMDIKFFLTAKKGKKLKLSITDGCNVVEEESNTVEAARTSCMTKERIEKQLSKLGTTPFYCKEIKIDMDQNIFISIQELNELRRNVVKRLIELRKNKKQEFIKKEVQFLKLDTKLSEGFTATVVTEEQLQTCLELNFERIYVNDLSLYHKYKNKKEVYYKLDRNLFSIQEKLQDKNLIGENILFHHYKNSYGDYFLNITNIYSAYYLLKNGLRVVPVSVELNEQEIRNLYQLFKEKFKFSVPLEVFQYGRVCNMLIKGNVLNLNANSRYRLVDSQSRYFPVFYKNDRTYLLNCVNHCNVFHFSFPHVKRCDFYNETKEEIINIVKKLK